MWFEKPERTTIAHTDGAHHPTPIHLLSARYGYVEDNPTEQTKNSPAFKKKKMFVRLFIFRTLFWGLETNLSRIEISNVFFWWEITMKGTQLHGAGLGRRLYACTPPTHQLGRGQTIVFQNTYVCPKLNPECTYLPLPTGDVVRAAVAYFLGEDTEKK